MPTFLFALQFSASFLLALWRQWDLRSNVLQAVAEQIKGKSCGALHLSFTSLGWGTWAVLVSSWLAALETYTHELHTV